AREGGYLGARTADLDLRDDVDHGDATDATPAAGPSLAAAEPRVRRRPSHIRTHVRFTTPPCRSTTYPRSPLGRSTRRPRTVSPPSSPSARRASAGLPSRRPASARWPPSSTPPSPSWSPWSASTTPPRGGSATACAAAPTG